MKQSGSMIVGFAVHRTDQGDFVHHRANVGKEVADLSSTFTIGMESPEGGLQEAFLFWLRRNARLELCANGNVVLPNQPGFGVEGVHVRKAAGHVKHNHVFCPRRVMSPFFCGAPVCTGCQSSDSSESGGRRHLQQASAILSSWVDSGHVSR